jgi:hypothetical protein
VKVISVKGLANHDSPESCVVAGNRRGEALTGGGGSGRQGHETNGVEVPAPSIARFGRLAYPMRVEVTIHVLLGRRCQGRPPESGVVGATRMACKPGGLNRWNDDGRESLSRSEVAERNLAVEPTRLRLSGKADDVGEETGKCTQHAAAVQVQSARKGPVEITSGRANSQQGLAATCKAPPV